VAIFCARVHARAHADHISTTGDVALAGAQLPTRGCTRGPLFALQPTGRFKRESHGHARYVVGNFLR